MRYLAALLTGLLGFLCLQLSAQDCDGADHTIYAGTPYYNPDMLTITQGETVAWVNQGGNHDVNGDVSVITGESFDNPEVFSLPAVMSSGMEVCMGTHTFTIPGTSEYDCTVPGHAQSGMVGTIVVEAPASGCNDPLACNYDETATSDVDCLYDDGMFDLSQGIWVNATASLDPNFDCAIQPAEGVLVQINNIEGEPVTLVVDQALQDWVDDLTAQGLLTPLEALFAMGAFNNAIFSFCGQSVSGDAGSININSEWNGEAWTIDALNFNLAPATELMDGCPDPTAINYDPCANPAPETCTYGSGCNDMAACNYDAEDTSDVDCIYVDTPYDLSQGVLVGIPFAQSELDTTATCAVQPINDNPVQMNLEDGQATFIIDEDVLAYFDAAVAAGLVSQQDADSFLNLMENATMTFCGDTMVATLPVYGEVVSAWTGSHWMITPIDYYLAPISTVPVGCGDPAADNFDLCAINDPTTCEYTVEECNDPLACNYEDGATNDAACIYFDTELFTLGENDFVGLTDFEECPNGYPGAYSLLVPLDQNPSGGPLYFTLFDIVEDLLIELGFDTAVQDFSTVTMSVCDTVLNYNSLVLGDIDLIWDGTGFPNPLLNNSFVVPASSLPIGCADEDACNFDPCVNPFEEDGCDYLDIGTVVGDTLVTEGGSLTFTATPGAGNDFEWSSDCASIEEDNDVITITATEDCEVCFLEYNSDDCGAEQCFNISVVTSVIESGPLSWQCMPNPATDALRVVWGGEAIPFDVFDLHGRLVYTSRVYPGVTELELSGLQPGFYLAGPRGAEPDRLAIQR